MTEVKKPAKLAKEAIQDKSVEKYWVLITPENARNLLEISDLSGKNLTFLANEMLSNAMLFQGIEVE